MHIYFKISAGVHHLILDQNLVVLKNNLKLDNILTAMLEKDSCMEQYVLSTENQEERIQRFIECLQHSPLEDYKTFLMLLYKTNQQILITKLVTSCKNLFCEY